MEVDSKRLHEGTGVGDGAELENSGELFLIVQDQHPTLSSQFPKVIIACSHIVKPSKK